ncbi:MAG: tyrosine-type recombinase/integrase [Thermomicrobiales bacterium]|nr:tyrosine-type recombinase/integrase [Thermomicrobiales bacterium]
MAVQPRYAFTTNIETGKREPVYEVDKSGAIKLDKDGNPIRKVLNWKVEVYDTDPVTGKQKRKVIGTFPAKGGKDEAKAADVAAKAAIRKGSFQWDDPEPEPEPAPIPTVQQACEQWIAAKRVETNKWGRPLSDNHIAGYESSLKIHVGPAFGDKLVTEVTTKGIQAVVQDWLTAVEGERKAKHAQTVRRAMIVLRGALEMQLIDDDGIGFLSRNPAADRKLILPKVAKQKQVVKPLDEKQMDKFLEEAESHPWFAAWLLAEVDGLRRAEILGGQWTDTRGVDDPDAPIIWSVGQTCVADQRNGGRPKIQPNPKTEGSRREIRLSAMSSQALRRHHDKQAFQRKSAGAEWIDNGLIFCNEVGEPIRPDSFSVQTKKMLDSLGFGNLGPHKLRHHAAGRMLRNGVPIALAAEKLGHSDVSLTYATYGNLDESSQEPVNSAIDRVLDKVGTRHSG